MSTCELCGGRVAIEGDVTVHYESLGDRVAEAYGAWAEIWNDPSPHTPEDIERETRRLRDAFAEWYAARGLAGGQVAPRPPSSGAAPATHSGEES